MTGIDMTPQDILNFWFSDAVKAKWFKPDDAFDAMLASRLDDAVRGARSGALADWSETAEGSLALVILLDQIPRNIYRGTANVYASDAQALRIAQDAIAAGLDVSLEPMHRYMLYMPFMHAEDLQAQERGMELFTALGLEKPLRYMKLHRDIVARFGRFPHRNDCLGRQSTAEEVEFLKQPNSSF